MKRVKVHLQLYPESRSESEKIRLSLDEISGQASPGRLMAARSRRQAISLGGSKADLKFER